MTISDYIKNFDKIEIISEDLYPQDSFYLVKKDDKNWRVTVLEDNNIVADFIDTDSHVRKGFCNFITNMQSFGYKYTIYAMKNLK